MIDLNSLKVADLKEELTKRGLSTKGVKKDLVARLEEALASDGTTKGSATEPDVAPKDTDMELSLNDNNDDNTVNIEHAASNIQAEAQEIAQIAPPVAEPVAAPAVAEVVKAPAPVPVPVSVTQPASSIEGVEATAAATIKPDPVEGTSMLTQEGLIDTTMSSTTPMDQSTQSKKRGLDSDDTSRASSSNDGTSTSETKELPAKKHKAIAINREGNELIIAAAKETLDADARRRSAAPSPSPAPSAHPGRTLSTSTIATVAEISTPSTGATDSEAAGSSTTGSTAGPRSPTEDKRPGGIERRDVRSQMQRQIQLAAQDRRPDATSKSATVSPTTTNTPVVFPVPVPTEAPTADVNPTVKRALTITNFLRPLTIPQVRRELAQYGEIETLWLDNIKTHCYVIYKEAEQAEKACEQTNNVVFPKETGRPLKPYVITAEAARRSIDAADQAQKAGKKPVIYTGQEPAEKPKVAPKPKTPIAVQKDEAGVIFKRPQVQVVQPTELFSMTKAKPMLYYKAVKAPPASAAPEDTATSTQVAEAN